MRWTSCIVKGPSLEFMAIGKGSWTFTEFMRSGTAPQSRDRVNDSDGHGLDRRLSLGRHFLRD